MPEEHTEQLFLELATDASKATQYIIVGLGWTTIFCIDQIKWPCSVFIPTLAFLFSAYHINFVNSVALTAAHIKRDRLAGQILSEPISS
jgi:hypothetical protein